MAASQLLQSLCLAGALVCLPSLRSGAATGTTQANDYRAAPLFYEKFHDDTDWVGDELELLRKGYVRAERYAPVDASSFNWERDSLTDLTWFTMMQDLRFLIPAVNSTSPGDLEIARAWFMRWYAVYMVPKPDTASWGEPIAAGYRAMVLSFLLKAELRRAHPDAAVKEMLENTIRAHQNFLMGTELYDHLSNHGFILGLSLYETARVVPNPEASREAVTRLKKMIERTVSPSGIEKEHAVAYHYVVVVWTEQMAAYFHSLPDPPRDLADSLEQTFQRMERAGYFLQDHDGRLAPIGDTDSVMVASISPTYRRRDTEGDSTSVFDPVSGYSIFKGAARKGDCRYIIFRVPVSTDGLIRHCHSDALSVFFSHAGETILGDAGRYSYVSTRQREYVMSACAHNVVLHEPITNERVLRLAHDVSERRGKSGPEWSGSLDLGGETWTRRVSVPQSGNSFRVEDSVRASGTTSGASLDLIWNLGNDVTNVSADSTRGESVWSVQTRKGQQIQIEIRAAGSGKSGILGSRLVRGQSQPLLGWYAPSRDVLRPVTTLVVQLRCDSALSVTTDVRVEKGTCTF